MAEFDKTPTEQRRDREWLAIEAWLARQERTALGCILAGSGAYLKVDIFSDADAAFVVALMARRGTLRLRFGNCWFKLVPDGAAAPTFDERELTFLRSFAADLDGCAATGGAELPDAPREPGMVET